MATEQNKNKNNQIVNEQERIVRRRRTTFCNDYLSVQSLYSKHYLGLSVDSNDEHLLILYDVESRARRCTAGTVGREHYQEVKVHRQRCCADVW